MSCNVIQKNDSKELFPDFQVSILQLIYILYSNIGKLMQDRGDGHILWMGERIEVLNDRGGRN
jgi:hypothetical protein